MNELIIPAITASAEDLIKSFYQHWIKQLVFYSLSHALLQCISEKVSEKKNHQSKASSDRGRATLH